MNHSRKSRAILLAVAALVFAGCGGDEEKPAATTGEAESSEPAQLAITATGSAKAPSFDVASPETPAGVTEIRLTNDGEGEIDGQLVLVDGEHPVDEVLAQLRNAVGGKAVEDWFQAKGGVGATAEGETGTVVQVLEPGTYYVLGGEGAPKTGEPASFEVTGEAGGELPEADGGTIEASEYKFEGEAKSGTVQIKLDNTGGNWHHFIAFPMNEGATLDQVKKFFETEKGKPPIDFEAGFGSSVFDPGVSQIVETELKAGKYAFVCFLPDRQGGPPHFQRGMVSEITVQ